MFTWIVVGTARGVVTAHHTSEPFQSPVPHDEGGSIGVKVPWLFYEYVPEYIRHPLDDRSGGSNPVIPMEAILL